jgi:replicative DNA helicase
MHADLYIVHALLAQNSLIDKVSLVIKPEYFSSVICGRIYAELKQLWFDGQAPDVVLIAGKLRDRGCWGPEYEAALHTPGDDLELNMRPYRALEYAHVIKRDWLRRQVSDLYRGGIHRIETGDEPEIVNSEIAGQADELLIDLQTDHKNDSTTLVAENEKLITDRASGSTRKYTNGLPLINEVLPAFGKHDYIFCTGYIRCGKTQLAINLVSEPLKEGARVLYFTLEADRYQVLNRFISLYGDVPYRLMESGDILKANTDTSRYETGKATLHGIGDRLMIYDNFFNIDAILNKVKIEKRRGGVDFVVIDYIGLVEYKGEEYKELSAISKKIARERKAIDSCFVVLQQIPNSYMQNKIDGLIPGKSTGQFGQDCDIAIHIDKENYESRETKIWLLKNKLYGRTRHGTIAFNTTWTKLITTDALSAEVQNHPAYSIGFDTWT